MNTNILPPDKSKGRSDLWRWAEEIHELLFRIPESPAPEQTSPTADPNNHMDKKLPWRLSSEVMIEGSDKITIDPSGFSHTLAETPHWVLKEISERLGKSNLVPGEVLGVQSDHETINPEKSD